MGPSRRLFLLGAAASSAAMAAGPSLAAADAADQARALLQALHAATRVPALSAAVVRGDRVLWAEAMGKADLELDVAAAPRHRFRLGSVSKVITASLAAQMAAKGMVDLDTPIATYRPDLPEHHRATTLKQLLTHRGGVRHYNASDFNFMAPGGAPDLRPYPDTASALTLFINDPLISAPGSQVSYTTYGYTLASAVLESAGKKPFLDLIQAEIGQPLGLGSLGPDDPVSIVPNRVTGYHQGGQMRAIYPLAQGELTNNLFVNPAYKWAGGGLIITPTDLARFGAAHLAPGVFSQATLDALFTPITEATPRSPPLGLGWRVDADSQGRPRWHHAGNQQGARAGLVVYPRQNLAIALASNLTGTPEDVLTPASKLADLFA